MSLSGELKRSDYKRIGIWVQVKEQFHFCWKHSHAGQNWHKLMNSKLELGAWLKTLPLCCQSLVHFELRLKRYWKSASWLGLFCFERLRAKEPRCLSGTWSWQQRLHLNWTFIYGKTSCCCCLLSSVESSYLYCFLFVSQDWAVVRKLCLSWQHSVSCLHYWMIYLVSATLMKAVKTKLW